MLRASRISKRLLATQAQKVKVTVSFDQRALVIDSPNHNIHNASFPFLWLRDSDQSPRAVHPFTKQKLFQTTDIPLDIRPSSVHVIDDALEIKWTASTSKLDSESVHPLTFLASYATRQAWENQHRFPELAPQLWDRDSFLSKNKQVPISYEEFKADLRPYLLQLAQYGLVFLKDVSTEQKLGDRTELRNVVEHLGQIRNTWYGELWDVKDEGKDSKNVAYTNLDLGLHGDLVHFQNPPRYQFLHCLKNHGIIGGASYFVDAFKAAEIMWYDYRDQFETLCKQKLGFEYRNGGHHTRWEHPVFELDHNVPPPKHGPPQLFAVNYAPPFQAPLLLHHSSTSSLEDLHRAMTTFANIIAQPDIKYEIQMQPGDLVTFDNRRVLHARTAFGFDSAYEGDENKGRWLKGAYMEGDAIWDRLRVTLSE